MSVHYLECPYCEKETDIELENQNAHNTYEDTCVHCKKGFKYTLEFDVNIYPEKIEEKDGK